MSLKAFLVFKNWDGRAFIFPPCICRSLEIEGCVLYSLLCFCFLSFQLYIGSGFFFFAEKGGVCWLSFCIKSVRNSFKIIAGNSRKMDLLSSFLEYSKGLENYEYIYFVSICHCKDCQRLPLSLAMTHLTNIHHYGGFQTSYLKQSQTHASYWFFPLPQPTLVTPKLSFFLFLLLLN